MDPLTIYAALERARERLFDGLRAITDEQYRQEFPFGMKRISATVPHMMMAEWAYASRMESGKAVDWTTGPFQRDEEPPFGAVESAWRTQAERTKSVIKDCRAGQTPSGGWTTIHETRHPLEGKTAIVRAAAQDIFMQLFSHETHHRAQVMSMLRTQGVSVQDLDYSLMAYIAWE